jgi:hypothetical protein
VCLVTAAQETKHFSAIKPFHEVIILVASTSIILNNTTLNLRPDASQQAENLHSDNPLACQEQ